jgi:hypothetical protein
MKLTKRKGFNFLRSYFDVVNEIENDEDKLSFLMAIINKQFLDEDPKDLKFIAKLSYTSQLHAIEKSVKGYKDKTKTDLLGNPLEGPKQDPCQGGSQGGSQSPCQQEKEKEQEKEKVKSVFSFFDFWELYPTKVGKIKCESKYNKIKESDRKIIKDTLNNFINHKPFNDYTHPNPLTYLNQERWNDVLESTKQQKKSTFVMDKF